MEFKEFKNENSKILKEYWLTQSEWDALDKTTVREGDIYHIVGTIDKGDLSADVNASLAKGDSSLQKPTATLAKESFVKVGIDGTQKFDESSYVVAPSTDGTAGQVLKKTATGTEWANESGGGGGKLYNHNILIKYNSGHTTLNVIFYTSNSTPINTLSKIASSASFINCTYTGTSGKGSVVMTPYPVTGTMDVGGVVGSSKDSTIVNISESGLTPTEITDTVTEV